MFIFVEVMERLRGKIVLVTGASSGIGEACARQFAAAGSKLILTARRADRLEALKDELIRAHNIEIFVKTADVSNPKSVEEFAAAVPAQFRAVDILINNAGLALGMATTEQTTLEDIDGMIDTNVKGVLYLIRAFVPGMIERGQGHIINIGSVAGTQPYPTGSVYCASKHAVAAITESLRMELVATPLRVTSISPGLAETEFSVVRFKVCTAPQSQLALPSDSYAALCVYL